MAAVIIGVLVWSGFIATKGNHLEPEGFISQVRQEAMSPNSSLMIIDFSLTNNSDLTMDVGVIDAWITGADGTDTHGMVFAASDMTKTFSFYPGLGPMLHPPLPKGGTIDPHKTVQLMTGVGFDEPLSTLQARKSVTLSIQDITGPTVVMTTK